MKPDWKNITSLAYETLVRLRLQSFPIPAKKIKCDGVMITSYQKYSEKTGIPIEHITLGYELDDAFLLKELRPGLQLILYNKEKYNNRVKHTLWHEIGHIKCGHRQHGEIEEVEAHFFASQANAPSAVIKEIARRGYRIDVDFLVQCFELSKEAAQKKMNYLSKYGFEHINKYDEILQMQFSNFINSKYPVKARKIYNDYYDEMEEERKGWN